MTRTKRIPVHLHNKIIGYVVGRIFYKTIRGSVHLLRIPRMAICNDVTILQDVKALGADTIVVKDIEVGIRYQALIADIEKMGFPIQRAGFEKQIGYPLAWWKRTNLALPKPKSVPHYEM